MIKKQKQRTLVAERTAFLESLLQHPSDISPFLLTQKRQ